jgi:hypothetical protein
LRPLNGREVAYVPPVPINKLLYFLALTTSNRKSLVFWADLDDCPGVLFTADSDLRDVHQLPDLTGAIITAPHHGSEANANAYSKVSRAHPKNGKTWSPGREVTADGLNGCTMALDRTAYPCPSASC